MVWVPRAVAWVLLAAVCGAWLLVRTGRDAPATVRAAHQLPKVRRAAIPFERWTITEKFAAHHALVVQVETRHLDEAAQIAAAIAEPRQREFGEILVYFHRPGRPDVLPPRRVQWTPAAGYVVIDYERSTTAGPPP